MPNISNFQDLLSDFSNQGFVGRDDEINLFRKIHTSEKPDFLILGISGQGGIGKTTLLELYKRIAEENRELAGIVNEDNLNVFDVLQCFQSQFQQSGVSLKHFLETQTKYSSLINRIEADTNAPPDLLSYVLKGATHFGLRGLRYVPVAGTIIDILEIDKFEDNIVEHFGELLQYILRKFKTKEDRALLLDPVSSLTGAFVADIDNISKRQKVFLIFDAYEKTQTTIEKWLFQLIDGTFGKFSSNIAFVVASRKKLGQKWTKYGKAIKQIELKEFSEEEATRYLKLFGVDDGKEISVLLKISNRLPILLALLVSSPNKTSDLSDSAVERFLSGTTPQQREIALLMSVPRFFDEDILIKVSDTKQVGDSFDWLINTPFARITDQGWVYHEVVRSLLNHYLLIRSAENWKKTHRKLSNIYRTKMRGHKKASATIDSKKLARLKSEYLYHKLCFNFTDASLGEYLSEFFIDYLSASTAYYLHAIKDIAHETENPLLNELVVRIGILVEEGEKQIEEIVDSIEYLIKASRSLTAHAKAKAYENCAIFCSVAELVDESIKYLSLAIASEPTNNEYYHERSHLLKDETSALKDINKAIELNPNEGLYYRCRANIYLSMDDDEKAIADISKSIEINPALSSVYHTRAHYYIKQKQYENALDDFTKAIELSPDLEDNYACRGKLLSENLDEQQKALEDFNKAISINPKSGEAFHQRGHVHFFLNNYNEAISDITKALEYNPKMYYGCLLEIYMHAKDYENLIKAATKFIDNGFTNTQPYRLRGAANYRLGKYDEAITDYSEAIQKDEQKDPELFLERGEVYISDNKIELAEEDFNSSIQSLEVDRKPQAIHKISLSYATVENAEYACKWLRKLFELLPKSISEIIGDNNFDKIRVTEAFSKLETEYQNRRENSSDNESPE